MPILLVTLLAVNTLAPFSPKGTPCAPRVMSVVESSIGNLRASRDTRIFVPASAEKKLVGLRECSQKVTQPAPLRNSQLAVPIVIQRLTPAPSVVTSGPQHTRLEDVKLVAVFDVRWPFEGLTTSENATTDGRAARPVTGTGRQPNQSSPAIANGSVRPVVRNERKRSADSISTISIGTERITGQSISSSYAARAIAACTECSQAEKCEMCRLLDAMIIVESSGDANAIGDDGDALGCLQIHRKYWADGTRFLGVSWPYSDARDPIKARKVVRAYLLHYGRGASIESLGRIHNGGPNGHKKASTRVYWNRVRTEIERAGR